MRVCKATGGAVQTSVNNLTPEIVGKCDLMEEVRFSLAPPGTAGLRVSQWHRRRSHGRTAARTRPRRLATLPHARRGGRPGCGRRWNGLFRQTNQSSERSHWML